MSERKVRMNQTVREALHADGTRTRLHYTLLTRGTPRRVRGTWVVGYGVDERGIAMRGGDCLNTFVSAEEAFEREVERADRECAEMLAKAPAAGLFVGEQGTKREALLASLELAFDALEREVNANEAGLTPHQVSLTRKLAQKRRQELVALVEAAFPQEAR